MAKLPADHGLSMGTIVAKCKYVANGSTEAVSHVGCERGQLSVCKSWALSQQASAVLQAVLERWNKVNS
jgi:hypothetical protein